MKGPGRVEKRGILSSIKMYIILGTRNTVRNELCGYCRKAPHLSVCPSSLQDDRATHKPSVKVAIFERYCQKRFDCPLRSAPGQQVPSVDFFNFEKSIFLFLQIASIARSPVSGCALRT